MYILHVELLILLSLACLLRSSNKSLTAVTPRTNITGNIAISFPNALIAGNQLSNTIKIKYKFAILWNCSSKFRGRKDKRVYFVVLILLFGLLPFGCSFRGVFGGTVWLGTTIRYRSSCSNFCDRHNNAHTSLLQRGGGAVRLKVYTDSDLDACREWPLAEVLDWLPQAGSGSLWPGGSIKSVLEPTRLCPGRLGVESEISPWEKALWWPRLVLRADGRPTTPAEPPPWLALRRWPRVSTGRTSGKVYVAQKAEDVVGPASTCGSDSRFSPFVVFDISCDLEQKRKYSKAEQIE